eukprot:9567433-Prorocentrum_lima.AAC.1
MQTMFRSLQCGTCSTTLRLSLMIPRASSSRSLWGPTLPLPSFPLQGRWVGYRTSVPLLGR